MLSANELAEIFACILLPLEVYILHFKFLCIQIMLYCKCFSNVQVDLSHSLLARIVLERHLSHTCYEGQNRK